MTSSAIQYKDSGASEDKKREKAIGLWLIAIVAFLFFAFVILPIYRIYVPEKVVQNTTDAWANKDSDAVETVKRCKIPGTNNDVMQLASVLLDTAKSMGSFIEFDGWAGFQVNGPLYEVVVSWKANGERKKARWDVDFVAKTIKPKNQEAFIFSGKRELLKFL